MAESNGIHNENSNSKDVPELKTTKPITLDSSGIMAKAWVRYLLILIFQANVLFQVFIFAVQTIF